MEKMDRVGRLATKSKVYLGEKECLTPKVDEVVASAKQQIVLGFVVVMWTTCEQDGTRQLTRITLEEAMPNFTCNGDCSSRQIELHLGLSECGWKSRTELVD